MKVLSYVQYDATCEKLTECDPYVKDGVVYTVEVIECTQEELALESLQKAKAQRQAEVDSLVVTTQSGKMFDGNEEAQSRMARAILALNSEEQTLWVLADNAVTFVRREELQEACV